VFLVRVICKYRINNMHALIYLKYSIHLWLKNVFLFSLYYLYAWLLENVDLNHFHVVRVFVTIIPYLI